MRACARLALCCHNLRTNWAAAAAVPIGDSTIYIYKKASDFAYVDLSSSSLSFSRLLMFLSRCARIYSRPRWLRLTSRLSPCITSTIYYYWLMGFNFESRQDLTDLVFLCMPNSKYQYRDFANALRAYGLIALVLFTWTHTHTFLPIDERKFLLILRSEPHSMRF